MAKTLRFTYVGLPRRNPATKILLDTVYRPLVPIQIAHEKKTSLLFEALVDSGADKSLFPLDIGESIGIDFSKLKANKAKGIGGFQVTTYSSPIILTIKNQQFETTADFSKEIDYPLLGRDGFFSLFSRIMFNEKKRQLLLELK